MALIELLFDCYNKTSGKETRKFPHQTLICFEKQMGQLQHHGCAICNVFDGKIDFINGSEAILSYIAMHSCLLHIDGFATLVK